MQIFEFRDAVVGDYREYIESFISIADYAKQWIALYKMAFCGEIR